MANIGKYSEEAHKFFSDVAKELKTPLDIDHAARVTTAIFHSLRERISVQESFHLIANLPIILKGIYIDGWKLSHTSFQEVSLNDFLNLVRMHSPAIPGRDFGNNQVTEFNVKAVVHVMRKYISKGEFEDIKQQLPKPVAELFDK